MSTRSAAALALAIAFWGFEGSAGAEQAKSTSPAAREAPRAGTLEVTGVYQGYSSKWITLKTDDGRRLRFEVDSRAVPDWRKRFHFEERLTVTYHDLGASRLPLAVGMKKAEAAPAKK